MTPEKRLRQLASEIANRLQTQMFRLQSELDQVEKRKIELEAQLDTTRLAEKRYTDFPVTIGIDYACPQCWIEHGKRSALKAIDGGTDQFDLFRCTVCGTKISVPT